MNSSFPKGEMTCECQLPLDISKVVFFFWYFATFKKFNVLLNNLKLGANGEQPWFTVSSPTESRTSVVSLYSLELLSLPPSTVCQPIAPWGLIWEHQRRAPSCWTESRVVSFPNQISDRETRFPRLWWEFFPDMYWVRSYFTVGMQTAHLRKFFFLFSVSLVF